MADDKILMDKAAAAPRRVTRRSVYYSAVLTIGELNMRCRVRDLSPVGALIETSVPLWSPAHCVLDVPKIGRTSGQLVWSDGMHSGLAFDNALDPLDVADLFAGTMPQRAVAAAKTSAAAASWRPKPNLDGVAQERARNAIGWLRSQKDEKRR